MSGDAVTYLYGYGKRKHIAYVADVRDRGLSLCNRYFNTGPFTAHLLRYETKGVDVQERMAKLQALPLCKHCQKLHEEASR